MTSQRRTPDTDTPAPSRTRALVLIAAAGVLIGAFLVWFFLIRDTSAASVDSSEAAGARDAALAEASPGIDAGDSETSVGLDGTWTIDTSIGTFDRTCLTDVCDATFAGFRIDEELATVGAKTVVGRSPAVSGSMEFFGTTITAVDVVVDMTQLITDDNRRTGTIRNQAIETRAFPEASFALTDPIELGSIPEPGEQIQIEAIGDFTIHGVTRSERMDLTAQLAGGVIVVFGQLGPILLADYDIDQPRAAIVLSVADNAIMELQLFLTR